jgi:hypothetical protein
MSISQWLSKEILIFCFLFEAFVSSENPWKGNGSSLLPRMILAQYVYNVNKDRGMPTSTKNTLPMSAISWYDAAARGQFIEGNRPASASAKRSVHVRPPGFFWWP